MPNSNSEKSGYLNQSVSRAVAILRLFLGAEEELSAAEIGRLLSLHQSTIFRFLFTLETCGLLERNPENSRYRLGVACLELGSAFLKNSDLRQRAIAPMESLRDVCGETVHLGILEYHAGVYIEKLSGLYSIGLMSSRVGGHFPLYSTGLGKALLANLPNEAIQTYLNKTELALVTPNTITDTDELRNTLEQIENQGYSIDNEENEIGVACVAAPIFKHNGLAGAISVSGPSRRIHEKISVDNLVSLVIQAAGQISTLMGGEYLIKSGRRAKQ